MHGPDRPKGRAEVSVNATVRNPLVGQTVAASRQRLAGRKKVNGDVVSISTTKV